MANYNRGSSDTEDYHYLKLKDGTDFDVNILEMHHSAVSPHTHMFYELVYMKSGFCLHETDGTTALLVEGDLFLMKPGQWHRYIGSHTVELYNCLFAAELPEELKQLPGIEDEAPFVKLHPDIAEQRRIERQINAIRYDLKNRETGWQTRVRAQRSCLLVDYARMYERFAVNGSGKSIYPNYVVKALEIISERFFDTELSVAGIADQVGVSPDYLSRQFKLLTGAGVQEYLRRYRFAKATELLLEGKSVSVVSESVGFSNLCHFSREFKKELGVTPTKYAKNTGTAV